MQQVARHLYRRGNSYEFRKVIPPRAQAAFNGRKTFSKSFGDVSRREAEHLAAECKRYCDRLIAGSSNHPDPTARIASFRVEGRVPDREEIDRAVRTWLMDQERRATETTLDSGTAKQRVKELALVAEITPVHLREDRRDSLLATRWIAEALAAERQWVLPPDDPLMDHLHDRVGRAQRELAVRLKAELNYEDRPAPTHPTFDQRAFDEDQKAAPAHAKAPVPVMDLFAGYLAERKPAPKTEKKWRTALTSLLTHLGHDDAGRITADDIITWKGALLAPGNAKKAPNPATVKNGYLGPVKTVLGWAHENKKIVANPAAGVTVRVPRRVINRAERGYSEEEAKLVLRAALAINLEEDASRLAFARRWLPWLCAYTGARITEMAQLRHGDVHRTRDGIFYVTVRPDAGSVKSGKARHVVLHAHLVEQGFPEAIRRLTGPLFYDPSRKREGSTGNSQAQKVGDRVARWVRGLGVTDPELQPNHGWRHAFISNARGKIDGDVRRAITGHSGKDEHDEYGNVSLQAMHEALKRFPRYRA
ncbi:hypothetical protein [Sphingomonas dokdonensis]|uniref:hypothetical protein n=1 Tax=Sphingomonas dokdonensis TaxID=344880 RepID=UPI00117A17DF|nr:hypothetical protein [Sphingomonas dokdonensis]